jgi:hypothetical protein
MSPDLQRYLDLEQAMVALVDAHGNPEANHTDPSQVRAPCHPAVLERPKRLDPG